VARVFISGSSDGLGLMAARLLIDQGHEVVLHGRNEGRSRDALAAAAGARGVVSGDLSTIAGARTVADQVNKLGRFDAVIHNAGVGYREGRVETEPGVPSVFAVNVLAPYILTVLIETPKRLVYVSSGMHRGMRPRMDDLLWTKRPWSGPARRLTRRASCAMFCWHLASLAAGKTLHPTRWSLDGWRQRWAAPQRRTIFIRGASPRPGLPRARMSWRDRRAGISIINALVRRTRSRPTSRPSRSCWPSAVAFAASLSIDPCGQTPSESR